MKDLKKFLLSHKSSIVKAISLLEKNASQIVLVTKMGKLVGTITDGDIRRNSNNLYKKTISKVYNKNPNWINESATALSALDKMNNLKITSILVTQNRYINKKIKKLVGILHLHHCLSKGIK